MIPMDVASRIPRLRAALPDAGCEALVVSRMVNVRYLSGFSGSAGLLLVLPDEVVLLTDGRYRDQSAEELAAAGVDARIEVMSTTEGQRGVLQAAVAGIGRLGLEAEAVTWAQQQSYAAEWFPSVELVPTRGVVEALRRVKDEGEVARMEEAARIADAALAAVRPLLARGPSEREVALLLDFEMRQRGAEASAFDTIVASGPNGAKPHARPSERRIAPGELVVIDFGAMVDGYRSDMTRTLCVGRPASNEAERMLEVVLASQQAGSEAVVAGVEARAVDQVCRSVIAEAGWADAFLHGTGHGVGLDIHEAPRVSTVSADTLVAGNVVTVEPGVYLPEHGGVRIEDTVVVTADGSQRLTNAPKEAIVS